MKTLIAKICVFLLRKMEYSALIGYEVTGGKVKCLNYSGLIYDCDLNNVDYRVEDDTKFDIPPGKFSVSFKSREEE